MKSPKPMREPAEVKPQDLMERRYLAEMESSGFFRQLWGEKR